MDFNSIKKESESYIQLFLEKYSVDITFDRLTTNFTSLYPSIDKTEKRIRLMGIEITYETFNNDGYIEKIPDTEEKRRVQLYVLKKRDYILTPLEKKAEILKEIIELTASFYQLKNFKKIEELETERISALETANYTIFGEKK